MSVSAWSAADLFGASLMTQHDKDTVPTDKAIPATTKAIGIYFSAHWCPPCRGFTPKLAEFYKNDLKQKGFEIIFVSSDKDEAAFTDYYKDMPWLALPYANRKLKETLSKRFKVSGIPSLVILDAKTGEIITKEGRGAVMEDPKGEEFPWIPKTVTEILEGIPEFMGKEGKKIATADAIKGKKLGLYFSAHWCPPCRNFTPILAKTYEKIATDQNFEIVFCSGDKTEEQFKEYFGTMPWLALPFDNKKAESKLSSHFDVSGIPCLVILDENRDVISKNATGKVRNDPEGASFPWAPELVNELDANPEGINDCPCLIVFQEAFDAESDTAGKQDSTKALLKATAEWAKAEGKAQNNEVLGEFCFFTVSKTGGNLGPRVREDCGLGDATVEKGLQAIVVDVSDDMACYDVPQSALGGGAELKKFLTAFASGDKPAKRQIEP